MSRREEGKALNRSRICAAAEDIIRREGIAQLNMRRLADEAGVSLRTPYNLFGSKTDLLIALLDEAHLQLAPLCAAVGQGSALDQLLDALARTEVFFASDEEYYRGIYHAIMTSDHPKAREAGVVRAITTAQLLMARAVELGELVRQTNSVALGRHLAIQMLAVLGMWGSGFFTNRESIAQVRRGWLAELLHHCSEELRPSLATAYLGTDDATEWKR